MSYLFFAIFLSISVRTLGWHLQCWQLQEYRFDRMKVWLDTNEGTKNLFNLWFFPGILPRPKISARIFIILAAFAGLLFLACWHIPAEIWSLIFSDNLYIFSALLIAERTIFLFIFFAVLCSKFPVWIQKKILFSRAKAIIQSAKNTTVIGITGSYGKSSTKTILAHLLTENFGPKAVLFNPENDNNEVAIARLILSQKPFFASEQRNFFVVEMGAYSRGEIATMCDFVQPDFGLLTGLGNQHLPLFGSAENIRLAKRELYDATKTKLFYAGKGWGDFLVTPAEKVDLSNAEIKECGTDFLDFSYQNHSFHLPWGGEFFLSNALLAIKMGCELGIVIEKISADLSTLPPLKKALRVETHRGGGPLLIDLYSANLNGVLGAINHLQRVTSGQKIVIAMPLRELGNEAESAHGVYFSALKKIDARVLWYKKDFENLGNDILGEQFFCTNSETELIQAAKKISLQKNDGVLLESRLPERLVDVFYP